MDIRFELLLELSSPHDHATYLLRSPNGYVAQRSSVSSLSSTMAGVSHFYYQSCRIDYHIHFGRDTFHFKIALALSML